MLKIVSTKDAILEHLRYNRGREIPVSEIADKYKFSYSRISNAIKDLKYKDEIEIEHRPLKKGKYTVLRLKGDSIKSKFVHEREVDVSDTTPGKIAESKKKAKISSSMDQNNLDVFIKYLKSHDFSSSSFNDMLSVFKFKNNFELITKIIIPTQYEVGKRWENGEISIGDEHLISGNIEKYLVQLIPLNNTNATNVIVLSPVEGEWHGLALLTIELLLIEKGFRVYNLARPLPNISLLDFISKLEPFPKWAFISITMDIHIGTLRKEVKNIKEKFGDTIKIAVGGQGIKPNMKNSFPDVNSVISNLDELKDFLNSL